MPIIGGVVSPDFLCNLAKGWMKISWSGSGVQRRLKPVHIVGQNSASDTSTATVTRLSQGFVSFGNGCSPRVSSQLLLHHGGKGDVVRVPPDTTRIIIDYDWKPPPKKERPPLPRLAEVAKNTKFGRWAERIGTAYDNDADDDLEDAASASPRSVGRVRLDLAEFLFVSCRRASLIIDGRQEHNFRFGAPWRLTFWKRDWLAANFPVATQDAFPP